MVFQLFSGPFLQNFKWNCWKLISGPSNLSFGHHSCKCWWSYHLYIRSLDCVMIFFLICLVTFLSEALHVQASKVDFKNWRRRNYLNTLSRFIGHQITIVHYAFIQPRRVEACKKKWGIRSKQTQHWECPLEATRHWGSNDFFDNLLQTIYEKKLKSSRRLSYCTHHDDK